jgi:hypothetical protein
LKRRKIQNTVFYENVKRIYSYADDDCICRRCDMRLHNAMKLNKEDAKGPSKTFKVESVDGASCSTTDTGIEFDVSLKLADHKTTVELDVHMFNSCFHLEPATQDRHFRSKFV